MCVMLTVFRWAEDLGEFGAVLIFRVGDVALETVRMSTLSDEATDVDDTRWQDSPGNERAKVM